MKTRHLPSKWRTDTRRNRQWRVIALDALDLAPRRWKHCSTADLQP